MIRAYQEAHQARLVVLIDVLFPESITLFEETLYDADPREDLHVMLATPGGDGETAIRLVRQAQSRCKELTVIVPDQAKSAGTLFVLGAHWILMGPTSDLGPVDPQFPLPDGSLAAGKAIIAAVEDAEQRIQANPQTYPLHASLRPPRRVTEVEVAVGELLQTEMLSDVTALMVQQARDEIARTGDQVREALASHPDREESQIDALARALHEPLIGEPQSHRAIISAADAGALGLPVKAVDPASAQWRAIWRIWTKYVALGAVRVYEGQTASQVLQPPFAVQ